MADVVKALVYHIGITTVGIQVPAAATKKAIGKTLHRMFPKSPKKIQTTLEDVDVY